MPEIKPWQRPSLPTATDGVALAIAEPDADGTQLIAVGMAKDGAMIMVSFKGRATVIQGWNQGNVYVVDEATGVTYDQVPVAPVVGPLFGKPRTDSQPGYVMLNNPGQSIKPGSLVTVVLGKYKREHFTVK